MPLFAKNPADGVDPMNVPQRLLANGISLPAIGLGTFANDRFSAAQIAESVALGLRLGYRLIDCAAAYGNEKEIGETFAAALAGGLDRREMFITSKLWNDQHPPEKVRPALEKTLKDLRLDYLDLYYIHWPFPNTHAPGAGFASRSPNAKPYHAAAYLATYRELEKALDAGLIRGIGTSNMTVAKLKTLLPEVRHRPVVNQMEMHPCFAQPEFFAYLRGENMWPVAYCPLGSPARPERDTAPGDVNVMAQPVIVELAKRHQVHPALICLKWAVQRGQAPIPSSVVRAELAANIKAVTVDPLSNEEMRQLAAIDVNCRLIKGQVFLWETASSWHDLWDEDGTIAT